MNVCLCVCSEREVHAVDSTTWKLQLHRTWHTCRRHTTGGTDVRVR